MKEFRKKQKRLKYFMNTLCVVTVVEILFYIGAEPMLDKAVNSVLYIISNILVFAVAIVLFCYFSKYGKCDKFLEGVENEIDDVGYYYTSREEKTIENYISVVVNDLKEHGYKINSNVEVDSFTFDYIANKGKDCFYIVGIDSLDKNDMIAYQESAIYDIAAVNVKRKCNGVMLYVCKNADDGAISLSKVITPLDNKEKIKFANSIVELDSGRCYFLGNKPTKLQQLIANFVMNCEVPIKEKFKANEKLAFQFEIEERMKKFNIKDFKNGNFFVH